MSWKATIVLAVLLAVAGVAYLLIPDKPAAPLNPWRDLLFPDLRGNQISRVDISRPGEAEIAIEQKQEASGLVWRIVKPVECPADPGVVQAMVWGVGLFARVGAMDPSKPEAADGITGLNEPRLVVTFHAQGGRRETLRFGREPGIQQGVVFLRHDGDPRVYLAAEESFAMYNKGFADIRLKNLVRYDAYRTIRVELRRKFIVARAPDRREVEYERTVLERYEKGAERGWYMVEPWKEKVDELKVQRLTSDLAAMSVVDFRPVGDAEAQGLKDPEITVSLFLNGRERPITIHFGAAVEGTEKPCLYARVEEAGEVAVVEAKKFEDLPLRRRQLRSDAIYPFSEDQVASVLVEAAGLGKLALERRPGKVKEGDEEVVKERWEVVEPKGMRVEEGRLETFVRNLFLPRITDFLGPQPDLKLCNLDPPDVVLTVKTRSGGTHVFRLGIKPDAQDGYLMREGQDEVLAVPPPLVLILKRMELNFLDAEVFSVSREKLRAFRLEARSRLRLEPVYYAMKLDDASKKWVFSSPNLVGETPDGDRVNAVLAAINYVKAESYVSREPEAAAKYRLNSAQAPTTLSIEAEGHPPATLYVSEDLSDQPSHSIYYARFEGSPVVFRVSPSLVETLKRVPLEKPKPEEERPGGEESHGH